MTTTPSSPDTITLMKSSSTFTESMLGSSTSIRSSEDALIYTRRKSSIARWIRGIGSKPVPEAPTVFAEGDIMVEGWLYKVSGKKEIKKRYFILRSDSWALCYYKSNNDLLLIGEFVLAENDKVWDCSDPKNPYAIELTVENDTKVVHLIANDQESHSIWLQAISNAIRREKVRRKLSTASTGNNDDVPAERRSAKFNAKDKERSTSARSVDGPEEDQHEPVVSPMKVSQPQPPSRVSELSKDYEKRLSEKSNSISSNTSKTSLTPGSRSLVSRESDSRLSGKELGISPPALPKTHTFTASGQTFTIDEKYEMLKPVGTGAYGVVIAAKNKLTGEKVAIKKIPRLFEDLVDAKRIWREIKLLQHFRHPNIISIVDLPPPASFDKFDDIYIVTDLMETDLHQVIYSRQQLSNEHVQFFLYQILCALKYMHSAEVLHRDLKPSNILLNANCDLKVCDFGLARGINLAEDGEQKSLTEYVVTRWYRAPEIMLSCNTYTKAIDVWSIGCIFAEMMTREPLFPGNDYIHQLKLILKCLGTQSEADIEFVANSKARRFLATQNVCKGVSLKELIPNATPEALDLLKRMLEFSPAKRISVEDALKHPYLSSLHDPTDEPVADSVIDFSNEIPDEDLTRENVQMGLFKEICNFHPEAACLKS